MLGVDIVSNERIKRAVERFGERFLKRVFTQEELKYCKSQKAFYPCLSARWACKEAVIKALYQEFGVLLHLREVQILGDVGKPARVKILREGLEDIRVVVSLSHERDYSVAVALVSKL